MIKPLLRTTLLASILFFLLVYMGMKYHWIDILKNKQKPPEKTLTLPTETEQPQPEVFIEPEAPSVDAFEPEIIKDMATLPVLDAMTKAQIRAYCETLYLESMALENDPTVDLLIGNCVVSNYQEPFEVSDKPPQKVKQDQAKKAQAVRDCQKSTQADEGFTDIEFQLLVGICVSNALSQ